MPKMKAYATFDLYLADQAAANQKIIRALRSLVKRTSPGLVESVKWGNGCWLNGKVPTAYVYSDKGFVQFGFIRGSELEDPRGLLEGAGQFVRHIKVRKVADIDPASFGALLLQAARYDTMPTPGKKTSRAPKAAKAARPAKVSGTAKPPTPKRLAGRNDKKPSPPKPRRRA